MQNTVLIINFLEDPYTLKKVSPIAIFSVRKPEQAKEIKLVNASLMRHLLDTIPDDAIQHVNTLLKMTKFEESNGTYRSFPTCQELGIETQPTPI